MTEPQQVTDIKEEIKEAVAAGDISADDLDDLVDYLQGLADGRREADADLDLVAEVV